MEFTHISCFASILIFVVSGKSTICGSTHSEFHSAGIKYASLAFESVCWYENYKILPAPQHLPNFTSCAEANIVRDNVLAWSNTLAETKRCDVVTVAVKYSNWSNATFERLQLPELYKNRCERYFVEEPDAQNENLGALGNCTDESETLNDNKENYPMRPLAYCLLNTLRALRGDDAIEAVKNERTRCRRDAVEILLARENEHRRLHGVQPLTLNSQLGNSAQSYANVMAGACQKFKSALRPKFFQTGGAAGENLFASSSNNFKRDKVIAIYEVANTWYSEVKFYPWPYPAYGGKNPGGEDHSKYSSFTQTVWNATQFVGYGFAQNENCEKDGKPTDYVVARYYPTGNAPQCYKTNVFQAIDLSRTSANTSNNSKLKNNGTKPVCNSIL